MKITPAHSLVQNAHLAFLSLSRVLATDYRGLGHEFLRHIERTKALIYVVDVAGTEGRDPCEDFATLREELRLYDARLLDRPALLVANKIDEEGAEAHLVRLREAAAPMLVLPVCAFFGEGLDAVAIELREMLERVHEAENEPVQWSEP